MKRKNRSLRFRLWRGKLYVSVWLTLIFVRIRLSFFGYKSFERSPTRINRVQAKLNPESIADIVRRVAAVVPGASCLSQAVAAQLRLARLGYTTNIRIGVKSDAEMGLKAHAWLIYNDRVILGGTESGSDEYSIITDMNSAVT